MSRIDRAVRHCLVLAAIGAAATFAGPAAVAADVAAPATVAKPPPKAAPKVPAKSVDASPPEAGAGKAGTSNVLLTRDELRQCMAEEDRMKKETADIVQVQAALATDRAEIVRMSSAIDADKASVNLGDPAAVDAFNERLKARSKLFEAYQAALPKFNQSVEKRDADRQAYLKACDNRRFDEKDRDAIKAGK